MADFFDELIDEVEAAARACRQRLIERLELNDAFKKRMVKCIEQFEKDWDTWRPTDPLSTE